MIFMDSCKPNFDLATFDNWDYEIPNFGIRDVLDGVPKRRGQRMHLRQLLKCELSGGGRVGRPRWAKNCRRRPRWKSRKVEKSVKQTCRRLLATHDPRSVQVYFKSSIYRLPTFSNNNDESGNGYLVWCSRTVTEGGHIYVTCAFCKLTSIRAPFLVWSPFHWLESERWSYNILFIMYTMYINI